MKKNINVESVLFDLKFLVKDIYEANVYERDGGIVVDFENGDSFFISVKKEN